MATREDYQDPYDQPYPTQTQPTAGNWWEGPRPSYVPATAPWPPPLPAGASYGPNPGQIIYAPGTQPTNPQQPTPGVDTPVTVDQPTFYPPPPQGHDDPGATPPPTTAPPPTNPGGPPPAPSPTVTPPLPTPPPAFKYDDFTAPDPNDLSSDPAFQFENAQGMQAIGARNAALGTLNTGGTLKDYVSFGQNLAHTRYGDLFNRKLTQYGTNRGNALDAYNVNYGTQVKDPWNESMQRASLDQNNNQFNASQDFNKWLENYKRSTLDPFDQKYKTLSLL